MKRMFAAACLGVAVIGTACSRGAPFPKQLTVFDRKGKVVRTLGEPDLYTQPVLSPDGTRLAVFLRGHIWVFDLSTAEGTQVTSPPRISASGPPSARIVDYQSSPGWSPDGSQIAFFSYRENYGGLYRKASNGTGSEDCCTGTCLALIFPSPTGRLTGVSCLSPQALSYGPCQ